MKATKSMNKKNQKGLLMFCLIALFSVSPSFAQSQGTPTGQQTQQVPPPTTNSTPTGQKTQQAPPPTTNSTPSSIPAEAAAETPAQLTDKESTFTYGAEMDFNSGYVWRGILLDDRPVWQPSAWISAFGFTFTAWGNVVMTSASGGAFEPLPPPPLPPQSNLAMTSASRCAGLKTSGLTLAYGRDWEKLKIEAALDAYTGQQEPDIEAAIEARNTMEGLLKLSYPAGPLRIFTTHAFDLLAYRGLYFGEAGLEYDRQITKNTEFTISGRSGWASAKFNDVYIGVDKSAFNFVGVEGSLTYDMGKHMYFRPHIEFSSITDGMLRGQLAPANVVTFGIAFGISK
jgi:hypothetical protein